jgi:splicing factor 3B subunit 5
VKLLYINSEWATNIHRDTLASHIGHHDHLSYFAVVQNESIGRVRAQMLEVRLYIIIIIIYIYIL